MIKRVSLIVILSLLIVKINFSQCAEHIFFSEYIEGSSNNKALELYNPTLSTVNLTDYVIYRYNNGSPTPTDSLFPQGTLASDSVFVIANPSAVAGILALGDTTHTITFYNGDDAMLLKHLPSGDTIDIIGQVGFDPGSSWPVGAGGTQNFTLLRKSNIQNGQTNWVIGATEWDVFSVDMIDSLGNHNPSYSLGGISYDTLSAINICPGDSASIFGNYENSAGFYYDTNIAAAGCDSITVQELIIAPTYNDTLTAINLCYGDSVMVFGIYQDTAGFYIDSNSSQYSCDSVSVVEIIVRPIYQDTLPAINICLGDSAMIFGTYEDTSGYNIDANLTTYGCDSITVQELVVHAPTNDTLPIINLCDGDSISIYGNFQDTAGFYIDSNTSQYGCDSVTVVEIVIQPTFNDTLTPIVICSGDSAYIFGIYQDTAGFYIDSNSSIYGCDSVTVIELIVNPSYHDTLTPIIICQNDSALIFGNYEFTSGFYIDSFTTSFSCDSLKIQELIVNNHASSFTNDTICNGDSILIGSNWYYTASVVFDTLIGAAANGCDSIVTHTIYINNVTPSLNLGADITACADGSVTLITSPGYNSYLWNTGDTSNVIIVNGVSQGIGTFPFSITVQDASNGCIDSDTINVTFINCVGIDDFEKASIALNIYPNPANDIVNITLYDKGSKINTIAIYDLTGKTILEMKIMAETTFSINLSRLNKGIYLVKAYGNETIITNKLIKQ